MTTLFAEYRIIKEKDGKTKWAEFFGSVYGSREEAEVALQACEDKQLEMAEWAEIEGAIPFGEKSSNEMSYSYRREWKDWKFTIIVRDVTEWRVA